MIPSGTRIARSFFEKLGHPPVFKRPYRKVADKSITRVGPYATGEPLRQKAHIFGLKSNRPKKPNL
jgi:hypothetical protein